MKNLKDLKGVKVLTKPEQKFITGGLACADPDDWCPTGCCIRKMCRPTEWCN